MSARLETRYTRAECGICCILTQRRPNCLPIVVVGDYCQTNEDALQSSLALLSRRDELARIRADQVERASADDRAAAADASLSRLSDLIGAGA
jgi:hypothetical protein